MLKKHHLSVQFAFKGLSWALKTQANYRIHLIFSVFALGLCWSLRVTYEEYLVIITLIFMGFVVECINTAIELTTDAIDKNWREDIGLAKDVSAGAMLLYAFGAAIVAGVIFLPKIIDLLN